jgi:hypothetical protein
MNNAIKKILHFHFEKEGVANELILVLSAVALEAINNENNFFGFKIHF